MLGQELLKWLPEQLCDGGGCSDPGQAGVELHACSLLHSSCLVVSGLGTAMCRNEHCWYEGSSVERQIEEFIIKQWEGLLEDRNAFAGKSEESPSLRFPCTIHSRCPTPLLSAGWVPLAFCGVKVKQER